MPRPSFGLAPLAASFVVLTAGCDSRAKQELALARAELVQTQAALEACQATAAGEDEADTSAAEAAEDVEDIAGAPAANSGPPPIVPIRTRVRANSAGTPELELWVRNDSEKAIDAFRFNAFCQNNFGEPVTSRIRNRPFYRGSNQAERDREQLRPGAERKLRGHWSMFRFEGCTKARVVIDDVHFVDDTTWAGRAEQEDFPGSAI